MQGLALEVLDVADNLDRAAAAVPGHLVTEDATNKQEVTKELALKNLQGLLEGVRAT